MLRLILIFGRGVVVAATLGVTLGDMVVAAIDSVGTLQQL
jgi:hypothetical protein